MRHRIAGRKLNRDKAHRLALRKNLIADLFANEQIRTTEAKARMLGPSAERIITMAKRGIVKGQEKPADLLHARRLVAARIARERTIMDEYGDKTYINVVKKLFDDIAPRYIDRPGGYTRMVKLGRRPGDNAKMAVLMLVESDGDDAPAE